MAIMDLHISANIRDRSVELQNFSVLANVSHPYWNDKNVGSIERKEKSQINMPEWSRQENTGIPLHFRRHNGFKDQERHDRVSRNFVLRQGTLVKYYATSYNPNEDPLYREDNTRTVERYFDVPLILSFQPQSELYNRFGLQMLDEFEMHLHMSLFLELNYASLKRNCVQPACDPSTHNPIWWQRGYEDFSYYGYTPQQIFPKNGDMLKVEAFNSLYTVESVKNAAPEFRHRERHYFWKLFCKDTMDNGISVSDDVLNDPEQEGFINNLLGKMGANPFDENKADGPAASIVGSGYELDSSCIVEDLKKDVVFRPPEVPPEVDNVTCDPKFHPCSDLFGTW